MKRECRVWKQSQKDQNQNPTSTNEGETTAIAMDGDVLLTILVEDVCLNTSSSSFDWILDFEASHHVTPCKENFVAYNHGDYGRVHLGNNHICNIVGVGDVKIKTKEGKDILLKEVRHAPKMCMSLISVG